MNTDASILVYKYTCMPIPFAPDLIRVQSCVVFVVYSEPIEIA